MGGGEYRSQRAYTMVRGGQSWWKGEKRRDWEEGVRISWHRCCVINPCRTVATSTNTRKAVDVPSIHQPMCCCTHPGISKPCLEFFRLRPMFNLPLPGCAADPSRTKMELVSRLMSSPDIPTALAIS